MKRLIKLSAFLFIFPCINLFAGESQSHIEIVALGTSNTNCKNVQLEDKFTTVLEKILNEQGVKARVINGGVDGDTPRWMLKRAQELVTDKTKIVLFEPGPNDTYKERSIRDSEKVIEWGCTEFCVNGLMAGNRRTSRTGYDLKHKESSTQRSHR